MVFRKRDGLLQTESWTYNGVVLDSYDEFNYLGTVLNYTCLYKFYFHALMTYWLCIFFII